MVDDAIERFIRFLTGPVIQDRWAAAFIPTFIGGLALMPFVLAAISPKVLMPLYLAGGLAFTVLALRCAKSGIVCLEDGVRVRNILRTSRLLRWAEIKACVVGRHRFHYGGIIELRSGERIPVTALETHPIDLWPSRIGRCVDEFNELLRSNQPA